MQKGTRNIIEVLNKFYSTFDVKKRPYGHSMDYFIWRKSKHFALLPRLIKRNGLMLDVGGGFGIITRFLSNSFINNVYNLDVSLVMLKHSPCQNILGTGEVLPFRSNSFDYVVSCSVLECVTNKDAFLSECYRVLKRQGLFLLITARKGYLEDYKKSPFIIFLIADFILRRLMYKLSHRYYYLRTSTSGIPYEPLSEDEASEKLKKTGFSVIRLFRVDNSVPFFFDGDNRFWRWFSDSFISPSKFGRSIWVICQKK